MTSHGSILRYLTAVLLVPAVLLLAGCATTPQIDWGSRVGVYTYDQAVIDMGPPDRSAKLSDGSLVAEWLTHRGQRHGYVSGFYGYGYGDPYFFGPPVVHYSEPATPDFYIRLTFDTNNLLTDAKQVRR